MSIKLGTIDKTLPYSKIFLGDVLKFQKGSGGQEIEFTACPIPTTWTVITQNTKYTSTNEYGTWKVTATGSYGTGYESYRAFDKDASSYWMTSTIGNDSTSQTIEIEFPVLIKPEKIYLKYQRQGNTSNKSKMQGFNPSTGLWEDLRTLTRGSSTSTQTTETVTIATNNFYSKIRVVCYRYNSTSGQNRPYLYELQITSGIMKV